jgi:NAD(P)H-hydrate epimerase
MTLPLAETVDGTFAAAALQPFLAFAADKDSLCVGPGLTTHPETVQLVRALISTAAAPLVLDADGLNALAGAAELLVKARAPVVLTPHPGELARLTGTDARAVQADRIAAARGFARRTKTVVVLKGAGTVTATPDGRAFINGSGNPGMATAGTGDVLAGVIAALLAQRYPLPTAAWLGVFAHGLAGDLAAAAVGPVGMIAGDLAARVPDALGRLLTRRALRPSDAPWPR